MKNDSIFLVMVMIVLLLIGGYIFLAPPVSDTAELAYYPVDLASGSITVEDQNDVTFVRLQAELSEPGWITIHESMSGAPATVIGTSGYLEAGVYDEIVIPVYPDMLPGYRYITLLHVDNGDKVFVIEEDFPVRVNGEVIRPDFVAVPEAVTIPDPSAE